MNFKDFLEKLEKCKVILSRERVLIIFKSNDKYDMGWISPEDTLAILKENFSKVLILYNHTKYDPDILQDLIKTSIADNDQVKYENFYQIWEQLQNAKSDIF